MSRPLKTVFWFLVAITSIARADTISSNALSKIEFEQKLGNRIALDSVFFDETGKSATLGSFFGGKPVILVMGYYECPMLCTVTANGLVDSLNDLKWSVGDQFEVIHASINPEETPALAAAKKKSYLKLYGRHGAERGWHFLTGHPEAVQRLAAEVGFHYAYDSSAKQYAHPSGVIVLTPDGRVARYLFGVRFPPGELAASLADAGRGKPGSSAKRLLLLCFHYNPITGKYGSVVFGILRAAGAMTVVGLAAWLALLFRRERRQLSAAATAAPVAEAEPASKGCG